MNEWNGQDGDIPYTPGEDDTPPRAPQSVEEAIRTFAAANQLDGAALLLAPRAKTVKAKAALLSAIAADRQRAVEEAKRETALAWASIKSKIEDRAEAAEKERDELREQAQRSTRRLIELSEPGSIGAFAARDAALEKLQEAEQREKELRTLMSELTDNAAMPEELYERMLAALGEQHPGRTA